MCLKQKLTDKQKQKTKTKLSSIPRPTIFCPPNLRYFFGHFGKPHPPDQIMTKLEIADLTRNATLLQHQGDIARTMSGIAPVYVNKSVHSIKTKTNKTNPDLPNQF